MGVLGEEDWGFNHSLWCLFPFIIRRIFPFPRAVSVAFPTGAREGGTVKTNPGFHVLSAGRTTAGGNLTASLCDQPAGKESSVSVCQGQGRQSQALALVPNQSIQHLFSLCFKTASCDQRLDQKTRKKSSHDTQSRLMFWFFLVRANGKWKL